MQIRSEATAEFLAGRLSFAYFLEAMEAGGLDVDQTVDRWSRELDLA